MTLSDIATNIKEHDAGHVPVLIAIEGFGGAGKTTLARQLSDLLGSAYVVPMDDFIVKEKLSESSWDKGGFDRKRLEDEVLKPASQKQRIEYRRLIWETNELSDPIMIPLVKFLIVEGISSYHPSIARYYDYKMWVDTPLEVAKARGHARDGSNENADMWDLWAENDAAYQQAYRPELHADFIIENR